MSKRKDTKAIWQASAALGTIAGLAALCTWQNNRITVSHYRCGSDKLAAPFEGFTILQVSDLHNKRFGKQQHKLLEAIRQQAPDCIVITGDLVDCHRTNIAAAMEFVRGAVRMAPVYYVPGNHEGRCGPVWCCWKTARSCWHAREPASSCWACGIPGLPPRSTGRTGSVWRKSCGS